MQSVREYLMGGESVSVLEAKDKCWGNPSQQEERDNFKEIKG